MGKHDEKKKSKGKKADKAKKGKKVKATEAPAVEADETKAGKAHLKHLAKVAEASRIANDKGESKKARRAARDFLESVREATAVREAEASVVVPDPATVDRDDEAAVKAYNDLVAASGNGGHFLTSTAESERAAKAAAPESDDEIKERVKAKRKARDDEAVATPEPKAKGKKAKAEKPDATQVTEVVETDKGREFAVGAPTEVEPEEEFDGLGRYKIFSPEKGRKVGYTRTTTYIDCLEDKTALTDWKMRMVLIGAGLDLKALDGAADTDDALVSTARKAFDAWNKGMTKLAKREAKGELDLGQFGLIEAELNKALKGTVNELAQTALDLGGANEKRQKGTDLHALTERLDRGEFKLTDKGDDDAAMLIETGQATHADIADLRAYDAKMRELGIEHFAIEKRIVIDNVNALGVGGAEGDAPLGIAGTLDRGSYYKFPGMGRRTRVVGDIKTGKIEWSPGKIGMQLDIYARGKGYDASKPEEREDLKLSKTKALLIHLPAGEARCEVYAVDLDLANKGTRLAREVRAWRNESKKVYDLKAPLTAEAVE